MNSRLFGETMLGIPALEFAYILNSLAGHNGSAAFNGDSNEVFVLKVENGLLMEADTLEGEAADEYRAANPEHMIERPTKDDVDAWSATRD